MRLLSLALLVAGSGLLALDAGAQCDPPDPPRGYPGPGDTTPGAPGPTGPATPGPSAPSTPGPSGPSTPGGVPAGQPGTPLPSGPSAPTIGGAPAANPLTLISLLGEDSSSWERWWELHREPYLAIKRGLYETVVTGSDDFFLGRGAKLTPSDGKRPAAAQLDGLVLPALREALAEERDPDVLVAMLIALAEVEASRPEPPATFLPFLDHSNVRVAEAATLALGVSGDPAAIGLLESLLMCDTDGLRKSRTLDLGTHVPVRQRAFAAYALGLIGRDSATYHRTAIVRALTRKLLGHGHKASMPDVRQACVLALGWVPLPIADEDPERYVEHPIAVLTRQQQVRWVQAVFEDDHLEPLVRGQAPGTVARLLEGLADDDPLRVRVTRSLMAAVDARSRLEREVVQGCTIALGSLADADGDPLDRGVRAALHDVATRGGDAMASRYALMSLAQVGGRPGGYRGKDRLEGTDAVRGLLLTRLARASQMDRAWSALALGVLERSLTDAGLTPSDDTRLALRSALEEAVSPSEVGALAVALGLTRDTGAGSLLIERLARTRDSATRGHLALAAGQVEALGARDWLRELLSTASNEPTLQQSVAMGLVLLHDQEVVEVLVKELEGAKGLAQEAALLGALAFAGDSRAVEPLVEFVRDDARLSKARALAAAALGRVGDLDELSWKARASRGSNYVAATPSLSSPSGGGLIDR